MAKTADEAHAQTDEIIAQIEKRLNKEYKQAAQEVAEKYKKYMAKFEVKDRIKQEQVANGMLSQEEYTKWRYGQVCIGKRWKDLKQQLATDLKNTDMIARSVVQEHMPEVYAINHNYATYRVEKDSLFDSSYTLYDKRTVENLVRDDNNLLPYPVKDSPTAKKLMERADLIWNREKIHSALTQGVLQGESIPEIGKRLEKVVGMDRAAAIRNARTMMTGVQNKARIDAYDDLRAKGVKLNEKWLATLDSRTRHSHRHLHGTYKDKETGLYANNLEYPGDPNGDPEEVYNCRCTEIAEVDGFSIDTPKTSPKLKGMTYEEWLNEHGASPFPQAGVNQIPTINYYKSYETLSLSQVYNSMPKDVGLKLSKQISSNAKTQGLNSKAYWDMLVSGKMTNKDIESILQGLGNVSENPPTGVWIDLCKKNPDVDKMLEIEKKAFSLLSDQEKKAIRTYTGSAYVDMNEYLRDIGAGKEGHITRTLKEAVDNCHNAFDKAGLEDGMVLRRGTDLGDLAGLFMKGDFERNFDYLETKTVGELNDMFQGAVGTYFGFTSTSSQWDRGFGGDVEVLIYAPPKSRALSVMNISRYGTGEGETLVGDNTRVVCEKIEQSDGHKRSKIRVYLSIIMD